MRRRCLLAVALVAGMQWAAPAAAQDWPTRPVTMVVPLAAGSSPDVLGRILTPRLSELLGQQVIIETSAAPAE
jgi:tripartite-type tricarboxylate transporter receptor subunit TctC